MTDIVKKLSALAKAHARRYVEDCKTYGHYMEDDEFQQQFESKFSELIIKECIRVIAAQRNPANLNYKPSERHIEALEQYFQINE